jgi:peptidyl-prolyl cis-trans isomerase-like protein 2
LSWQVGKKGYAQLQTTHGNLNVELHCDIAPRTAWNFLTLAERGYFDDMALHRLVPGFMVQGGDPTGTGAGGSSAFGGRPFRDEFDTRILHDTKGVLSMANSGANSNGSQFFMLFAAAKHLDLKHSVFGRVVGGLSTLDKIEEVRIYVALDMCRSALYCLSSTLDLSLLVHLSQPTYVLVMPLATVRRSGVTRRRSPWPR